MKGHSSLVRSTGVIAGATVASRILGLVRDSLIAGTFSKALTTPFFTAFILPNTLRRLFAEGALSAAFIPVFTECLEKEGRERAARLGAAVLKVLGLWLVLVSALGVLFAPEIVRILPGEHSTPEMDQLTVALLRIMFPYILLIGLSAATMGMLNSLGKFFAPAISPALLNVAMITSILLGGVWLAPDRLVKVLAVGVLAGGVLQFLIQILPLNKKLPLPVLGPPLWDPLLSRVLWLMLPLIFGQAITEVNIMISTYFAWTLPGAVSYLFYSNRIIQFPLGVFGIAVATATFPQLSRDAVQAEGSRKAVADTLVYALGKILFIMLPSAVGVILVGRDVLGAILNHGEFLKEGSLDPTFRCAMAYAVGLPAFASLKIFVSAFYARKNTRTPTIVGAVAVIFNIIFILLLKDPLGAAGMALATTLASLVNLSFLAVLLRLRLRVSFFRKLLGLGLRSGVTAFVMGLALYGTTFLLPPAQAKFLAYLLRLGVMVPVGVLVYGGLSFLIQPEETWEVLGAFRGKMKRK
jgi:putative peptidoglycan lipid II flippase